MLCCHCPCTRYWKIVDGTKIMSGFWWLEQGLFLPMLVAWLCSSVSISRDRRSPLFPPTPRNHAKLKDVRLMNCWLSLAAMFLLCAVKVPEAVSDMLTSEFHHPETVQRLNAVLKFHTLWRFRYQVWPRMEEGAQQIFKVRDTAHMGIWRTNPTQGLVRPLNLKTKHSVWPKKCFFFFSLWLYK